MSVTLTPQVEDEIRRWVETGRYADADAVVRDALHLLEEHEGQLDVLRAKLQVGLDEADRGEVDEWTPELRERLRREAQEMYRRGEQPDPDVQTLRDEHDRRLQRLRAAIAEGDKGEALPWTPELMEQLTREAEEMVREGIGPHAKVCP
ncbi:MAG TPA: type II toxin-antitoxin system ParD family antitoxin [Thermomicrobiales bacterium]|jgi:antitoxin ParD1/3/4